MVTTLLSVSSLGAFTSGGSCDYPAETDVRAGVVYADGGMTGNVVLPDEADVVSGVDYGANGTEFTGDFTCYEPPDPATAGDQPFAAILERMVIRVAQALNTSTTWVRPVASDDYKITELENLFSYLRAYGPSPIDPTTGQPYNDDGAGRWRRVVGRRVRIYLYTRSGVDVYGGDDIALQGNNSAQVPTTPPTMPGQFALEDVVLNALDDWVITYTDNLGNVKPLTIGPVHWVDSESGPPVRKPENEEGLIRSHIDVQVCYVQVNQRTEPAPTGLPAPNPGN